MNYELKALIESGTSIKGTGILHDIAREGNIVLLEYIAEHGKNTDWNEANAAGWTPLKKAIFYKQIEVAKALIMLGASIKDSNILCDIIRNGDFELLEFIAEHRKYTDWNDTGLRSVTPLKLAIFYKQIEIINILIKAGAKPQSESEQADINSLEFINDNPVYKYCPADVAKFPTEIMLANTYSQVMKTNDIHAHLMRIYNNEKLTKLMLTASLDFKDQQILLVDAVSKYNIKESHGAVGLYRSGKKQIMVQVAQDGKFYKGVFTHEVAHKLMYQLFNKAEPYSNDSEKIEYHSSITKTFNNILGFCEYWLQRKGAGSLLEIKPNYHSLANFERGKFLYDSFVYADKLDSQKSTSHSIQTNATSHKEVVAKNCFYGVIKDIFLTMYDGYYAPSQEDAEFIVRYPQAIATGCYDANPTVQAILEPIKAYWDKVIEKKMDEYIAKAVDVNTLVCPANTAPFGLVAFD